MNNRSIDGLRRRTSAPTKLADAHTIGRQIVAKAPKKQRKIEVEPSVENNNDSIRDFLSSVKDGDPTNLTSELPEKTDQASRNIKAKTKTKVKPPKKKRRTKRIILSILGGLLVIIIAVVTWLYIQGNDFVSKVTGGGNLLGVIFADPDTPLEVDPDSGRTNILVFGTEGYDMDDPQYSGGWLTDSMMVASLDQDSGKMQTISLPRDLKSKTCTSTSKLNEVYYCTYSKNNKTQESRAEYEILAAKALSGQIEEILGIKIQYFIHVNWQAVVQIVDIIGGVDVAFVYKGENWNGAEVAIETTDKRGLADYWDSKCRCYTINFENGKVAHLNGEQALGVVRARNAFGGYGASGGNFSREQFQQKIIQAMALKLKQTDFVADFVAALNIKNAVGDNLRMDFKDVELKTLLKLAGTVDMANLHSIPLQDNGTGTGESLFTTGMLPVPGVNNLQCGGVSPGCLSYVYPRAGVGNYAKIHEYVKRKLSSDPVISEEARVTIMNATTVAGLATNEGNKLKNSGYNIIKTTNAPSDLGETEGIVVYQLNKGMVGTAKALKKLYKNLVIEKIPVSLTNEATDFVIVVGNGYAVEE